MADVTEFASKIEKLHAAGIEVCAGVVGDPSAKEQIRRLRLLLDPSVYLFVNAMQGLRKPLSEEDVRFFNEMDNLFDYDRRNAKACLNNCSGGRESCLLIGKGGCMPAREVGCGQGISTMILLLSFSLLVSVKYAIAILLSAICGIRL